MVANITNIDANIQVSIIVNVYTYITRSKNAASAFGPHRPKRTEVRGQNMDPKLSPPRLKPHSMVAVLGQRIIYIYIYTWP